MLNVTDPVLIGATVTVAMFVGVLACIAIGRRIGVRAIERHGTLGPPSVGSLEAAVFALLGLMIAFTFSGALTRFDLRRSQIVDEANAIGTAYLRIDLLPAAEQPRLRESFRRYVDARIATYRKLPDLGAAREEFERSQGLQAAIWSQALVASRTGDARPDAAMLFVPALNQMFDITTVRAFATQMHPPVIIYAMLVGLALAAALLAGYQSAGEAGYASLQKIAFAAAVALTFYVILNIEYPRLGWADIEVIDNALVNVRAAMQ